MKTAPSIAGLTLAKSISDSSSFLVGTRAPDAREAHRFAGVLPQQYCCDPLEMEIWFKQPRKQSRTIFTSLP